MLFFISIDINVRSTGMLKPPGERFVITSPTNGAILRLDVMENQAVNLGDTILSINTDRISKEVERFQMRQLELSEFISDINKLADLKITDNSSGPLSSNLYRQSVAYYLAQMNDLRTRAASFELNYTRNKSLVEQKVIAIAEFEPIEAEYKNLVAAIKLLYDRQMSNWQNELSQYLTEQRNISSEILKLVIQQNESTILSPINGVVQRIEGISVRSYVQPGQKLLEISPDSTLLVECYVSPRDIGYMSIGQEARFQRSILSTTTTGE